jgi:hypothetical protein
MHLLLNVPRYSQRFDPACWREHGFTSEDDSRFWDSRACGVACAAMVIEFLTGEHVATHTLLHQGRALGAYSPRGWVHAGLAQLLGIRGVGAEALPVKPDGLSTFLISALHDGPVIASVARNLPTDGSRGGHLTLVTGMTLTSPASASSVSASPAGAPDHQVMIHFNDPGRWGEHNTTATMERFAASFSGRVIRTWRSRRGAGQMAEAVTPLESHR